MIGVYIPGFTATQFIESIKRAEDRGVPAFWLTSGGLLPDVGTVFAAAAMVTERIKLGTAITQTWPRHPVAIASQCIALEQIAPGRFRIGLGPSHQRPVEEVYGVTYAKPLLNLREYLTIVQAILKQGEVEFSGTYVKTRARLGGGPTNAPSMAPIDVPVMASALRPASFRLCGELADGAISWVCPWEYLREVALPALREGAAEAGRSTPPLVAHTTICLSADRGAVHEAARAQVGRYGALPNYLGMFRWAGYDDPAGADQDRLIDELVVAGSDRAIIERLARIIDEGAGEIIAHPIIVGDDRAAEVDRVFDLVARANREAGVPA
jgi:F420-dependent oxidoreductase-like protein